MLAFFCYKFGHIYGRDSNLILVLKVTNIISITKPNFIRKTAAISKAREKITLKQWLSNICFIMLKHCIAVFVVLRFHGYWTIASDDDDRKPAKIANRKFPNESYFINMLKYF
jgi:hypothetical protein